VIYLKSVLAGFQIFTPAKGLPVLKLRAGIITVCIWMLAAAAPAVSCTVSIQVGNVTIGRTLKGVEIPIDMVAGADLIVRVTAVGYATVPAEPRRTMLDPNATVRFRIEEVVKGAYTEKELILPGGLSDVDDYNERGVPYDFVRPAGRSGDCVASWYRSQAQFLLVLKRNAKSEYSARWYPLGPTNEQLRSAEDPWLLWVRERVARR